MTDHVGKLRQCLEAIDAELIELITERMDTSALMAYEQKLRGENPLTVEAQKAVYDRYVEAFGPVDGSNIAIGLMGHYSDVVG